MEVLLHIATPGAIHYGNAYNYFWDLLWKNSNKSLWYDDLKPPRHPTFPQYLQRDRVLTKIISFMEEFTRNHLGYYWDTPMTTIQDTLKEKFIRPARQDPKFIYKL